MAPTVCSEKKVRVAGMKEVRRRDSMGMTQAVATTSTTSAGITQSSTVLSYVVKGSMYSGRRQHRRRVIRLPRAKQISKTSTAARNETKRTKQIERAQLDDLDHDDFNETSIQILRIHSSSSNFKTVLQPTTANNNSSKSSNKMQAVKHYDQMSGMDEEQQQDSEDEQGDNDSGYDFAMGSSKQTHSQQLAQQQQCSAHNEGLLSIALKTIKLVQRNKLLQKRLAQLQLETSEFIASVLANPENRHYREKITSKTEAPNKVSNVLLRH